MIHERNVPKWEILLWSTKIISNIDQMMRTLTPLFILLKICFHRCCYHHRRLPIQGEPKFLKNHHNLTPFLHTYHIHCSHRLSKSCLWLFSSICIPNNNKHHISSAYHALLVCIDSQYNNCYLKKIIHSLIINQILYFPPILLVLPSICHNRFIENYNLYTAQNQIQKFSFSLTLTRFLSFQLSD